MWTYILSTPRANVHTNDPTLQKALYSVRNYGSYYHPNLKIVKELVKDNNGASIGLTLAPAGVIGNPGEVIGVTKRGLR